MTGVPEKAIFQSVTVYDKNLSNQCNLLAQVQDKYIHVYTKNSRLISDLCGLPVYYIHVYMKNKQHDLTMEIKEFMTLISQNFVYEKSMSIQFCVQA